MSKPRIVPPAFGAIARVARSSVVNQEGVLKFQCNIWIGSDAACYLPDRYGSLSDFVRSAVLGELGRLEGQICFFGSSEEVE